VRRRIAAQLVGDELQRWPLLVFQDLAKEALGGSLVSVAGDQDVEDVAILVHRSPKIMAFAADRDEQLVHVPDVPEPTLSSPQSAGVFESKLPTPASNGFVGYSDATLRQQVFHVAKAQREPMVQPHGMADDFRWKAVASIQRFHELIVADGRQLDNAIPASVKAGAIAFENDLIEDHSERVLSGSRIQYELISSLE
jgi:hypothetical protein